MPSLKDINKAAGTNFRRWKEVTEAVTVKETEPTPEVKEAAPMPEQSEFPPRITNERIVWQMRGAGYEFEDGYPVRCPKGAKDFQAGDVLWKFDGDDNLLVAWEPTTWPEQREVQYEAIIDQPLVRAGDGQPDDSMFTGHRQWATQWNKQDAIREWSHRDNRVAWFEAGVLVYQTTIGALLEQSLAGR